MKKIQFSTLVHWLPSDLFTPVGIYLKLRDRFRDTILLESTDHHAAENSFSFIGVNAIGGIEITNSDVAEFKFPTERPKEVLLHNNTVQSLIWEYMQSYEVVSTEKRHVSLRGCLVIPPMMLSHFLKQLLLIKSPISG